MQNVQKNLHLQRGTISFCSLESVHNMISTKIFSSSLVLHWNTSPLVISAWMVPLQQWAVPMVCQWWTNHNAKISDEHSIFNGVPMVSYGAGGVAPMLCTVKLQMAHQWSIDAPIVHRCTNGAQVYQWCAPRSVQGIWFFQETFCRRAGELGGLAGSHLNAHHFYLPVLVHTFTFELQPFYISTTAL